MKTNRIRLVTLPLFLAATVSVFGADKTKSDAKSDKKASSKTEAKAAAKADAKAESKPDAKVVPGPDGKLPADVAAVVDGEAIKYADLERAFKEIMAGRKVAVDAIPAEQKKMMSRKLLEQMVDEKLVTKASADLKVTDEELTAELDLARKKAGGTDEELTKELQKYGKNLEIFKTELRTSIRQNKWVEEQVKKSGKETTEVEAKEFYDKNPDQFKTEESVSASHILFRLDPKDPDDKVEAAGKKAEAVVERLKKGEDFAKLAEAMSEDPSAKGQGGSLGSFPRHGKMVEEFSEAAFKLKKGEFSEVPIRTQFGIHVIKVTDRKEAGTMVFDEIKEKLIAYLNNNNKRTAVQTVLADLRTKGNVQINMPDPSATPEAQPAAPPQPAPEASKPAAAAEAAPAPKPAPVEVATPPVAAPAK